MTPSRAMIVVAVAALLATVSNHPADAGGLVAGNSA